jgi:hypothetical protein
MGGKGRGKEHAQYHVVPSPSPCTQPGCTVHGRPWRRKGGRARHCPPCGQAAGVGGGERGTSAKREGGVVANHTHHPPPRTVALKALLLGEGQGLVEVPARASTQPNAGGGWGAQRHRTPSHGSSHQLGQRARGGGGGRETPSHHTSTDRSFTRGGDSCRAYDAAPQRRMHGQGCSTPHSAHWAHWAGLATPCHPTTQIATAMGGAPIEATSAGPPEAPGNAAWRVQGPAKPNTATWRMGPWPPGVRGGQESTATPLGHELATPTMCGPREAL